jgi:hypothetical protein
MDELLEALQSCFAEPIPDGRLLRFRLDSTQTGKRIVASLSRHGPATNIAVVSESEGDYLVQDFDGAVVRCRSHDEVTEELGRLAVYTSGCWNCKRPIVLTAETRCPKCNRFVRCSCGKCLCDKYSVRRELGPEERAALAQELNRRYGHLFQEPGPGNKDGAQM